MKLWHNNILFSPFDDDAGGGGGGEEHLNGDEGANAYDDLGGETAIDDTEDPNHDDPSDPQTQAAGTFDYEALARANAVTLAPILETLRPQQSQQQQPLTQEEFNKLLNRFDPDDELVDAMFGENATKESRAAALKRMVEGIYGHMYKATGTFVQEQLGSVRKELEPFKAEKAKREYEGFKAKLVNAHPWIKGYGKLHDHAIQAVAGSGSQFKSEKEAADAIAGYIEQLVKQVNPNFVRPQGQVQNQRRMPVIAGSAGGGRSGGAGSGASGGKQEAWRTVLGPRKS